MNDLDALRKRIDSIDSELLRLLNERAACAEEIGRVKSGLGMPAYSPEREEEVMRHVASENEGPLSEQAVRRLFERIIDESRSIERTAISHLKNKE